MEGQSLGDTKTDLKEGCRKENTVSYPSSSSNLYYNKKSGTVMILAQYYLFILNTMEYNADIMLEEQYGQNSLVYF